MRILLTLLAFTVISCGDKMVACPAIALECPAGERHCESADEDGCEELTMGEGECLQVIYCAVDDSGDAG